MRQTGSMTADASIPDDYRELLSTTEVAALTTVGPTGYPQTTAIWYMLDGDVIRTSLHSTRQKYLNMVRHPQANLFLIDPQNPFRTIEVRGDVTFEEDTDLAFLQRLLTKYGQTLETFQAPTDGRVGMTLTPTRVRSNG